MRVRREDSTVKSGVGQWQWRGETPETVCLPPWGLPEPLLLVPVSAGPGPAPRSPGLHWRDLLTGLRVCSCWGCAIYQGGRAYYFYIRGTNSPFPGKSVSDKNKWAVLFLLLREKLARGTGKPLLSLVRGSVRAGWEQSPPLLVPEVAGEGDSRPKMGGRRVVLPFCARDCLPLLTPPFPWGPCV